jgi:hypothetical protein
MSGVLRVLAVEPPEDIVNKPKNTVPTVKSIAAMMTTTNRSIVRLPEQFLPAPYLILARLVSSAACGELHAAVHTKWLFGADSRGTPICCTAIPPERQLDAHLPTQQCLCHTECGVALRNKLKQCRKSVW